MLTIRKAEPSALDLIMAIQRLSFQDFYDKYHGAGSPYLETK